MIPVGVIVSVIAILVTVGLAVTGAIWRLASAMSGLSTEVKHLREVIAPLQAEMVETRHTIQGHGERLAALEALKPHKA